MGVYIGGPQEVTVTDYTQAKGPCSTGYHVPLQSEWQFVYDAFIGLGLSGGSNFRTYLKIPAAGCRYYDDASLTSQGVLGQYRSCNGTDNGKARWLRFNVNNNDLSPNYNQQRAFGFSIRPFKDEIVIPDSSWAVLYQGTGTAGIYHNSSLGLISISSDGETWKTIADKNLGATTVYNSGNTLSQNNCGKYYQWGNNNGFNRTGSVTTSSSTVNASAYGPGNYYSNGTFRIVNPRDNSDNRNLRGGETVIQQKTIYPELKNAYIGEYKLITTPGIYHNATLGLISLSSDGSTRYTIADKNLGATQVWNSGDTLSEDNCGKFYQWGNNYGFHFNGSVSSSTTQVNASNYGPGNYYSSSTFIRRSSSPYYWDSSKNQNLWGGTTMTNAAMQGPCPTGFHVPLEWTTIHNVWRALGGGSSAGTNFGIALKLPFAGRRSYSSANPDIQGTYGLYWTVIWNNIYGAYLLSFSSTSISPQVEGYHSNGYSIRPFKNEAVQPDTSRTKLK